jgi:Branched-chain amino acid transport system / permease component
MTSAAAALYRHAMSFSLVDFLQALAAGILVGSAYALMCIVLGIIFGAMRVINFAQGDFLMLGMYAAFYLSTTAGLSAFFGPEWRADCRRFPRRANYLRAGMAAPPLHRRPRHRPRRCPDRGCRSLRTDPDHARHLSYSAKMVG